MEKLLEKIAGNTNPKSSFHILLLGNESSIRTKFSPVLALDDDKEYEMALVNLETYYSFPNIDNTNNNFRYSPDNGKTWNNIDIPEGCYEIQDINQHIQRIMTGNAISLKTNNNTLRCILNIAPNYKVDFTTQNSIRTVIGFQSKVYTAAYNESENIVNIININSLRITNSIIGSSYSNGSTEPMIYSFCPNVGPGYKIIEVPHNLVYLPIILNKIDSMETKLTDHSGKLVNLRGEELSLRFHIRQK